MLLVDDLFGLPIKLGMMVLERIRDDADEQMLKTEESVRKKYMEIHLAYDAGELKEEDYKEWTSFLEKRLEEIKQQEGGGKEDEGSREYRSE